MGREQACIRPRRKLSVKIGNQRSDKECILSFLLDMPVDVTPKMKVCLSFLQPGNAFYITRVAFFGEITLRYCLPYLGSSTYVWIILLIEF